MKLKTLIESEFQNIEKEVAFISKILNRNAKNPIDDISLRAASLSMTAIYNGMEKILVQILFSREIRIKESFSWHTEVLRVSKAEKIITENTQKELAGFLSFRHFIRHAYSFEINSNTVETILEKAPKIAEIFYNEIKALLKNSFKEENE